MKIRNTHRSTEQRPASIAARLGKYFLADKDPSDSTYQQRTAAEMINGFSVLSVLIFSSMAVLLLVHIVQPPVLSAGTKDAPTAMACALLASAAGVGLLVSKSIRYPKTAFLATAAFLVSAVVVISVDRLQRVAGEERSISSIVPIIFLMLVLSATVLPLRPCRVFGLGALLFASSCLTARLMDGRFHTDFFDFANAATMVTASVVIAARSTSHRIRIHHAHSSAMAAERQAEAARERALIAESVITMERLAASLSHEMNTPIGALTSATETLVRGVRREASFPRGSRMPQALDELAHAIGASTGRLTETVARIQRFANLDRSGIRLVDINQLVQDAVSLMNPPSVNHAYVKLNLSPLPQIWCRPHALSVAFASTLNIILDTALPATVETYSEIDDVVVTMRCAKRVPEFYEQGSPGFASVGGRVRASGWDLFAARQLLRENGGELHLDTSGDSQQVVTIRFASAIHCPQDLPQSAIAGVA
jgi:signal transduction histidine kinase